VKQLDIRMRFILYLVWQNADGTLYPIANRNWQAELEGNTNVQGKGVTNIVVPNGVTANAYVASNAIPAALNPKGPFLNNDLDWEVDN
jgi:hypothetical protein